MSGTPHDRPNGFVALRLAVADALDQQRLLASTASPSREGPLGPNRDLGQGRDHRDQALRSGGSWQGGPGEAEAVRLGALVDLARDGDSDAFGALYDHYHPAVYRFTYYRVSSQALAEDLTSETFFRALRSMNKFRWQGRDFGAWLTTIARNLIIDHYKSGRVRLEVSTDDFASHERGTTTSPEDEVMRQSGDDILRAALSQLPSDQQDCLVLRFLNGSSLSETALVLSRSEGAVKQLQLRALRNLAKLLPEGLS